jgi:hypothetical protein
MQPPLSLVARQDAVSHRAVEECLMTVDEQLTAHPVRRFEVLAGHH